MSDSRYDNRANATREITGVSDRGIPSGYCNIFIRVDCNFQEATIVELDKILKLGFTSIQTEIDERHKDYNTKIVANKIVPLSDMVNIIKGLNKEDFYGA
jgi:predicted DNA-binding ArsR family transcriptional regulator